MTGALDKAFGATDPGKEAEYQRHFIPGLSVVKSFRSKLREAAEQGVLLTVKYGVVLGLFGAASFLAWERIAVLRAQAERGQIAHQWISANINELGALIDKQKAEKK